MTHDTGPGPRLSALWDHLGLGAAHVATQMAGDIAGIAQTAPHRLAGSGSASSSGPSICCNGGTCRCRWN